MRVSKNPAGIAVSGEATLMGIWSEGNGLYMNLSEPAISDWCVLYRECRNLKDYGYCHNRFMGYEFLQEGNYAALLKTLQAMNRHNSEVDDGTAA